MRKQILLIAVVVCLQASALEAMAWCSRLGETDPRKLSSLTINHSVDPVTGEFHEEHVDLIASGKEPMVMTRVYGPDSAYALLLAPGWWLKLDSSWSCLYNDENHLVEIRQLSVDKTQLLNWIKVHRHQLDDGSSEVTLEACDGGLCRYRFERLDPYGPGLLTYVDTVGGDQLRYTYRRDPVTSQYRLIRREDGSGHYLINEYDEGSERVIQQMAPIGIDAAPLVTTRLEYGDGWTIAYDAHSHKTVYQWSDHLVTRIDTYASDAIYRSERFSWDDDRRLTSYEVLNDSVSLFQRTFGYDDLGNCVEVGLHGHLSGFSNQIEHYATRYQYANDETRLLLGVSEDNGRVVTFSYDPAHRLTAKLLWDGQHLCQRLFYEYDAFGYLTRVILDDGSCENPHDLAGVSERHITDIVIRNQLPGAGLPLLIDEKYLDLSTGIEQLSRTTVNTYDSSGKLIREEFFDGEAKGSGYIERSYDSLGRLTLRVSDAGVRESYTYGSNGLQLTTIQDNEGHWEQVFNTYDWNGRLIAKETKNKEGQQLATTFRYDLLGQLVASIDFYGNETEYSYDDLGRCVATIYPHIEGADGQIFRPTTRHAYDALDRPIVATDANGYDTYTQYNLRGQPIRIEHADGTSETFVYHLNGSLKTKKNRQNVLTNEQRDGIGRITEQEIVPSFGEKILLHALYSGFRLLGTLDTLGHEVLHTFDFNGNLISTCVRSGVDQMLVEKNQAKDTSTKLRGNYPKPRHTPEVHHNIHFVNDLGQRVLQTTVVDQTGNQEITTYDALGHVSRVEQCDLLGQQMAFREIRYDAAGNQVLIRALQTSGHDGGFWVSSRAYGPENRLEKVIEGLGTPQESTSELNYNDLGQLEFFTKPDGCVLYTHYDGFGRVYELFSSDGSIAYRYGYDENNRLVRVEDLLQSTVTERQYDLSGNVLHERLANGLTLKTQRNSDGQITHLLLPDDSAIEYRYDPASLRSIHRLSSQGVELYAHVYHDLDEASLIGDLGSLRVQKDLSGRCTSVQSPYWSETISEDGMDVAGRVTDVEVTDPAGRYDVRFSYDAAGQLISEEAAETHHYTYDKLANRLSQDTGAYEVNGANQLISTLKAQYKYDNNGNRTGKHVKGVAISYRYDAFDRLLSVENPGYYRVEYAYDPFDRRMSKRAFLWDDQAQCWSISDECRYLYDGKWEIGAVNTANEIVELRVLGKGLVGDIGAAVAMEFGGRAYAPIHDRIGSVVCLVDMKQHQVVEYSRKTAFGEEQLFDGQGNPIDSSKALNPWRFSSKRCDAETGLVYYGRRFYDPEVGRWLTKDPAGMIDGLNNYAFLRNNPIQWVDSEGLFSLNAVWENFSNSLFDYVRNIGAFASTLADLLHRDTRVFTDVGEQAQLIGTQLIGPHIWDVIGFYAPDPESGVHGYGEVSDRLRFSHINGILNTREDCLKTVETISHLHGGVNIHYTYRPTAGWTWDFVNACLVKVGYMSPTAYCLAQMWKDLIHQMGGIRGGGLIIHYAHSLGGAETDCARHLIASEEQKMIRVFTFGSPVLSGSEEFESVTNFVARLDLVCWFDPVRYLEGFFSLDNSISFVGSYWGIPLLDHLMVSTPYLTVMERLGKEYRAVDQLQ